MVKIQPFGGRVGRDQDQAGFGTEAFDLLGALRLGVVPGQGQDFSAACLIGVREEVPGERLLAVGVLGVDEDVGAWFSSADGAQRD